MLHFKNRALISLMDHLYYRITYLERNFWSGPQEWRSAQTILSLKPFFHVVFHWSLIVLVSLQPHPQPSIGVPCAGLSLIKWNALVDWSHSWTAACSRSFSRLSKSRDTYRSTYEFSSQIFFLISQLVRRSRELVKNIQGKFLNLVGLTFDKDTLNQSQTCIT